MALFFLHKIYNFNFYVPIFFVFPLIAKQFLLLSKASLSLGPTFPLFWPPSPFMSRLCSHSHPLSLLHHKLPPLSPPTSLFLNLLHLGRWHKHLLTHPILKPGVILNLPHFVISQHPNHSEKFCFQRTSQNCPCPLSSLPQL